MIKGINFLKILICLLVVIFGCNRQQKDKFQFSSGKFINELKLSGSFVNTDQTNMPMGICVFAEKNLLLLIDIHDSFLVKAYDLKTMRFIKAFARKGAGPNEQLDCHKLQYSADLKHVFAVDRIKQKIFIYKTQDILDPMKTVFPADEIVLYEHQIYNPSILSDGSIVDYTSPEKNKKPTVFSFYDPNGSFLFNKGAFPLIKTKYSDAELNTAFLGWYTPSKDGENIILSYLNTDFLDLYSKNGNLLKRIQGPDFFDPAVKSVTKFKGTMIVPNDNAYHAYSSARMDKDEVYVLYEGKNIIEEGGYHKNLLFLFNKQLKPQTLFDLEQPIFAFDIDWKTRVLYGLTHNFKKKNLLKIKLP